MELEFYKKINTIFCLSSVVIDVWLDKKKLYVVISFPWTLRSYCLWEINISLIWNVCNDMLTEIVCNYTLPLTSYQSNAFYSHEVSTPREDFTSCYYLTNGDQKKTDVFESLTVWWLPSWAAVVTLSRYCRPLNS